MKTKKNITTLLTSLLTIMLLTVTFSCEKMNPSEPDFEENSVSTSAQNIKILEIGGSESSLLKTSIVSEWIYAKDGGELELEHISYNLADNLADQYGSLKIYTKLQILPGAMSADAEVSLTIDDDQFMGAMDVEFGPHGTVFSQPALLSIYAQGLDLSSYDEDDLGFYYYNEEAGVWEQMKYESFNVSIEKGVIQLTNAQLPHFSRYAIGTE